MEGLKLEIASFVYTRKTKYMGGFFSGKSDDTEPNQPSSSRFSDDLLKRLSHPANNAFEDGEFPWSDNEEPTIFDVGFPIPLPHVSQVSRRMNVDAPSECSITISYPLSKIKETGDFRDIFLMTLLAGKFLDPWSAIESEDERSTMHALGAALESEDEGVLNVIRKALWDDEKNESQISWWHILWQYFMGGYLNSKGEKQEPIHRRFMKAVFKAMNTPEVYAADDEEEFAERQYVFQPEDMVPVWIFAKAPPRRWLGENQARWWPYFHGYIVGYRISYNTSAREFVFTLDCRCPLNFMALSQMASCPAVISWVSGLERAVDRLAFVKSMLSWEFREFWTNLEPYRTISHVVDFLNSARTYIGMRRFLDWMQNQEENVFDQWQKSYQDTTEYRYDLGEIGTEEDFINEAKDASKFHLYDFIYATRTEEGFGVPCVVEGVFKDRSFNKLVIEDNSQTDYLSIYEGRELVYNDLDDDVEKLRSSQFPLDVFRIWWGRKKDPEGSSWSFGGGIRDKWIPKVYLDPLLCQGSPFSRALRGTFNLTEDRRTSVIKILKALAFRLGANFYSDPMGNLVFTVARYDDAPRVVGENGVVLFEGWSMADAIKPDWIAEKDEESEASKKVRGYLERINNVMGARPRIFHDYDNRYVLQSAYSTDVSIGFDSGKIFTISTVTGDVDLLEDRDEVIALMSTRGIYHSNTYLQTKYGGREFLIDKAFAVPRTRYGATGLLSAAAHHILTKENARATTGTISLSSGTLWIQQARTFWIPGLTKKAFISGISDEISISSGIVKGAISTELFTDASTIIGNPFMDYHLGALRSDIDKVYWFEKLELERPTDSITHEHALANYAAAQPEVGQQGLDLNERIKIMREGKLMFCLHYLLVPGVDAVSELRSLPLQGKFNSKYGELDLNYSMNYYIDRSGTIYEVVPPQYPAFCVGRTIKYEGGTTGVDNWVINIELALGQIDFPRTLRGKISEVMDELREGRILVKCTRSSTDETDVWCEYTPFTEAQIRSLYALMMGEVDRDKFVLHPWALEEIKNGENEELVWRKHTLALNGQACEDGDNIWTWAHVLGQFRTSLLGGSYKKIFPNPEIPGVVKGTTWPYNYTGNIYCATDSALDEWNIRFWNSLYIQTRPVFGEGIKESLYSFIKGNTEYGNYIRDQMPMRVVSHSMFPTPTTPICSGRDDIGPMIFHPTCPSFLSLGLFGE